MKFLKKNSIKNFIKKNFSFDSGIDLQDDVEVLYRKNVVIKNIIFVSNILYSIILFAITIGIAGKGVNWLWSVLPMPLTFVLNITLKQIIDNKEHNLLRQQIGAYICAIYLFLSSLLVYTKLCLTESTASYSEPGYLLIFYSLVIISFYQSTKMLKNIYMWVFAIMIVVHFLLTHNFIAYANESNGIIDFFTNVLPNNLEIQYAIRDIIFRTLVLMLFMLIIYIISDIGYKMSAERKLELKKRQSIQDEFTDVVSTLYNVVLDSRASFDINDEEMPLELKMIEHLSEVCGISEEKKNQILEYANYNKEHKIDLNLDKSLSKEEQFLSLQSETEIAKNASMRLQLSQKAENIVRAHLEGSATNEFRKKMYNLQNNLEANIILLVEVYLSLRSVKSYKRPYPHSVVVSYFEKEFYIYFDDLIMQRFINFNKDFEEMYDNYNE